MERIRDLDRYQKAVLLILAAMLLIFTSVYIVISLRVGFEYHDTILQLNDDGENTVYSGKIDKQQATFTVSPEKAVTFQYGNTVYGPYTVKEDPTAIPRGKEYLTGVEMLDGDEVFFRGGVSGSGDTLMLFDENGELHGFNVIIIAGNGIAKDGDGNIVDPMEPSAGTILALMDGPELTSKGEWLMWLLAVVISIMAAVSILFADELFRWSLSFQIRNADIAEPSDWELAGRYISWTVFPIIALVCYIMGLR